MRKQSSMMCGEWVNSWGNLYCWHGYGHANNPSASTPWEWQTLPQGSPREMRNPSSGPSLKVYEWLISVCKNSHSQLSPSWGPQPEPETALLLSYPALLTKCAEFPGCIVEPSISVSAACLIQLSVCVFLYYQLFLHSHVAPAWLFYYY